MKTLHIISNLDRGGAELALYNLLSGLPSGGCAPSVVSLLGRGEVGGRIAALGIPVHALEIKFGPGMVRGLARLSKIVRETRPDLIQGWMYHGNLAATIAGYLAKGRIPVLWNIRHTPTELRYESRWTSLLIRLEAILSRKPAGIIYNARRSAACHEALGYSASNRNVIPNGIDLEQFRPSRSARAAVRAALGFSGDTPLVGLVANYRPVKGHATFLDAAALLVRRMPEVRFLLIGNRIDWENRDLAAQIEQRGLLDHIRLLGLRRDVPRWLAALDAATSSSWSEGFANVVGEAMACGVPCVVTDAGDSAWITGSCGRIVPPRDPSAMAGAWHDVLTMPAARRKQLGLQARERIREHFSLPAMVHAYSSLHRKVNPALQAAQ